MQVIEISNWIGSLVQQFQITIEPMHFGMGRYSWNRFSHLEAMVDGQHTAAFYRGLYDQGQQSKGRDKPVPDIEVGFMKFVMNFKFS